MLWILPAVYLTWRFTLISGFSNYPLLKNRKLFFICHIKNVPLPRTLWSDQGNSRRISNCWCKKVGKAAYNLLRTVFVENVVCHLSPNVVDKRCKCTRPWKVLFHFHSPLLGGCFIKDEWPLFFFSSNFPSSEKTCIQKVPLPPTVTCWYFIILMHNEHVVLNVSHG